MKISQVDDDDIKKVLRITDLENAFDTFIDKKLNRVFNLNKSIYINAAESSLSKFQCTHPMHWTTISYKIYGTTRLAWLLWKINNVDVADTFKPKQPGDIVYFLPTNLVQGIVSEINSFMS